MLVIYPKAHLTLKLIKYPNFRYSQIRLVFPRKRLSLPLISILTVSLTQRSHLPPDNKLSSLKMAFFGDCVIRMWLISGTDELRCWKHSGTDELRSNAYPKYICGPRSVSTHMEVLNNPGCHHHSVIFMTLHLCLGLCRMLYKASQTCSLKLYSLEWNFPWRHPKDPAMRSMFWLQARPQKSICVNRMVTHWWPSTFTFGATCVFSIYSLENISKHFLCPRLGPLLWQNLLIGKA